MIYLYTFSWSKKKYIYIYIIYPYGSKYPLRRYTLPPNSTLGAFKAATWIQGVCIYVYIPPKNPPKSLVVYGFSCMPTPAGSESLWDVTARFLLTYPWTGLHDKLPIPIGSMYIYGIFTHIFHKITQIKSR